MELDYENLQQEVYSEHSLLESYYPCFRNSTMIKTKNQHEIAERLWFRSRILE